LSYAQGWGDPSYLLFDESLQTGRHWKLEPERWTEIIGTTTRWCKDSFIIAKIRNIVPGGEIDEPLYLNCGGLSAVANNHLGSRLGEPEVIQVLLDRPVPSVALSEIAASESHASLLLFC
jgi:hypothetical protein